jgi:HipA-like kinase
MNEADWSGLVIGRRKDKADHAVLTVTISCAPQGGSCPCQVLAADNKLYWMKTVNNPQGSKVLVSEQVIARCGRLIGAPTCDVALLEIPSDLDGYLLRPGRNLSKGIAHGSADVPNARFSRTLDHRNENENRKRHALLFALFDWCWGSDAQWLYQTSANNQTLSHDHGHYFPAGPSWTVRALRENVDGTHLPNWNRSNLDKDTIAGVADKLEKLRTEELAEVLRCIPMSWPIGDTELEALGFFLDQRRASVAQRLRQLI